MWILIKCSKCPSFAQMQHKDALLETIPDIDQALLQFINVMNLVDPLLHFSPDFIVNRI